VAVTDTLEKLSEYYYNIALPAPSFFGQFKEQVNIEDLLAAFAGIGFDEVFEVALAAEIVGHAVHEYLAEYKGTKPVFSSACPAVLRLMQIKYPELLGQVAPFLTPMEVAARLAKEDAARRIGVPYEEIGAFFVSPCPAKVTEMRNPMTTKDSAVNGVIGVNLIYKDIIKHLGDRNSSGATENLQRATSLGMAWGYVTGESHNIAAATTLAVSGIHNVISLLEEIERGELKDVDFVELQACTGGCVGGPLNIQNLFVGRIRLRDLIKRFGSRKRHFTEEELSTICGDDRFIATEPIEPRAIMTLDEDVSRALMKMERLDQITNELPGLDCGACGSPSCRALAEDIIRGIAYESDCVIKLREKVKTLAEEILDLARIIPPSMSDGSKKNGPNSDQH
jgi:hypothetical protein